MRKNTIRVGKQDPASSITDCNGCAVSVVKYFHEIPKFSSITKEEEKELLMKIQNGDKKAERVLFLAHSRFVISVARKMYAGRKSNISSVSLNDFIQWGNIGLLKAMYTCDHNFESRFLSFAVHVIKSQIDIHCNKVGAVIYVSPVVKRKIRELKNERTSSQELFINEDESPDDSYMQKVVPNIPMHFYSLDDSVGVLNGVDDTLNQFDVKIEDLIFEEKSADNDLIKESLKMDIMRVLDTLVVREREIIILSFGLKPYYEDLINRLTQNDPNRRGYYQEYCSFEMSNEDIGSLFYLTAERVRQIRDKAILRISTYRLRRNALVGYLGIT